MIIKKDCIIEDKKIKQKIVKQKRITKFDNEAEYKLIELYKILKEWNETEKSNEETIDQIVKLYEKELKLYNKISNTSMEVIDINSTYQEIKKRLKKQTK